MQSTTSNTIAASCLCTRIKAVLDAVLNARVGRLAWAGSKRWPLRTSHPITSSSDSNHAVLSMFLTVRRRLAALDLKGCHLSAGPT